MACSFLVVKDDSIITAGKGVVDGITRRIVLELIGGRAPVDHRFVTVSESPSLDEAFITSSRHEVMPIASVDRTKIGNGKPGPIAREVMELFNDYAGKNRP